LVCWSEHAAVVSVINANATAARALTGET